MKVKVELKKEISEILKNSKLEIKKNIDLLALEYYETTGKRLNRGCSACVNEMILTLKSIYQMTQYTFKKHSATYKNKKGDKTTISNSTMTDEKAVEFLRTNPERIKLFSRFPSNWKVAITGKEETEKEKENRIAIEAEMKASEEARAEDLDNNPESKTESVALSAEEEAEKAAIKAAEDAMNSAQGLEEELMRKSLKELRAAYPKIQAKTQKDFVGKILAS